MATSKTDVLLTFIGPAGKLAGKIGKPILNRLCKTSSGEIKSLFASIKNEINKAKAKLSKRAKKVDVICPIGSHTSSYQGFSVQATNPCKDLPILSDLAVGYLKATGKGLKKFYTTSTKSIPVSEVVKNLNLARKVKKSSIPNEWHRFYDEMGTVFNNFKNSSGVPIKKLKNYEVYFADFIPHSIGKVKITVAGNRSSDYTNAAQVFINQYTHLVPSGTTVAKFEEMRNKLGLIWHHHEDLQTMVLVDTRIHNPNVSHFGSVSIIGNLNDFGTILISN